MKKIILAVMLGALSGGGLRHRPWRPHPRARRAWRPGLSSSWSLSLDDEECCLL